MFVGCCDSVIQRGEMKRSDEGKGESGRLVQATG